jgi:hypothetical protein
VTAQFAALLLVGFSPSTHDGGVVTPHLSFTELIVFFFRMKGIAGSLNSKSDVTSVPDRVK